MIRDALAELHQGRHVDIVVRVSIRRSQRCPVGSKKVVAHQGARRDFFQGGWQYGQ
jgi:xanthine/CO dehydrogenase XdhC/CoxF family maturation factor